MRQNRIPKPKSRGKRGSEETEPRIRAKEREGASVPGLLRSTLPRSRSRVGRGKGFRVRRSENERREEGEGGRWWEGCYRTQSRAPVFLTQLGRDLGDHGCGCGVPLVLPDLDDEPAYPYERRGPPNWSWAPTDICVGPSSLVFPFFSNTSWQICTYINIILVQNKLLFFYLFSSNLI